MAARARGGGGGGVWELQTCDVEEARLAADDAAAFLTALLHIKLAQRNMLMTQVLTVAGLTVSKQTWAN
jgi:hypothetical protein